MALNDIIDTMGAISECARGGASNMIHLVSPSCKRNYCPYVNKDNWNDVYCLHTFYDRWRDVFYCDYDSVIEEEELGDKDGD